MSAALPRPALMTDNHETPSERARRQVQATRRLAVAVRQRRKLLGVTQQALARMAGCGLVFIYSIEQGKSSLRLDKLLAVLGVLGLELTIAPGESAIRIVEGDAAGPPGNSFQRRMPDGKATRLPAVRADDEARAPGALNGSRRG